MVRESNLRRPSYPPQSAAARGAATTATAGRPSAPRPASDEPAQAPKKRGRPRKNAQAGGKDAAEEEADDENEGNSTLLNRSPKRRSPRQRAQAKPRPSSAGKSSPLSRRKVAKKAATTEQRPSAAAEGSTASKRVRKPRQSTSKDAAENGEQPSSRAGPSQAPKKRGRPSLKTTTDGERDEEEDEVQSKIGKRKRPRGSLPSEHASTAPKRRGRPSGEGVASDPKPQQRGHRRSVSEPDAARPRKRRRPSGEQPTEDVTQAPGSDSDGSPPPYRHLTTRTRKIPRGTIESKWTPLDPPSISSVSSLLSSAARPVLLRLSNRQKHTQAAAALNAVSNRLKNKLSRGLPFPPSTTSAKREDELEFERTIAGIAALELQLDPLLHSVELLKREKERAEKELDREYKVLSRLSTNARTAARERREHLRKMHALVPERRGYEADMSGEDVDSTELLPADKNAGRMFVDIKDAELSAIAGQISNHMESLRGNLQQIDGVIPAIGQTRAALRARLAKHFGAEAVDDVVLG